MNAVLGMTKNCPLAFLQHPCYTSYTMWNGMLSPNLMKRKLPPGAVSFDPTEAGDENIENIDPTSTRAEGILDIQFTPGGETYSFWATYQFYQDFEASGFDTAFLAEYVHGPGGWGWPYGRTTQTGWSAPK